MITITTGSPHATSTAQLPCKPVAPGPSVSSSEAAPATLASQRGMRASTDSPLSPASPIPHKVAKIVQSPASPVPHKVTTAEKSPIGMAHTDATQPGLQKGKRAASDSPPTSPPPQKVTKIAPSPIGKRSAPHSPLVGSPLKLSKGQPTLQQFVSRVAKSTTSSSSCVSSSLPSSSPSRPVPDPVQHSHQTRAKTYKEAGLFLCLFCHQCILTHCAERTGPV